MQARYEGAALEQGWNQVPPMHPGYGEEAIHAVALLAAGLRATTTAVPAILTLRRRENEAALTIFFTVKDASRPPHPPSAHLSDSAWTILPTDCKSPPYAGGGDLTSGLWHDRPLSQCATCGCPRKAQRSRQVVPDATVPAVPQFTVVLGSHQYLMCLPSD